MNKGALLNSKMYLSAPIEYEKVTEDWRKPVKDYLTNRFGINVFDPAADEKHKINDVLEPALDKGDFDLVERIATAFVKKGMSEIDRSDFLVLYNPRGVPTTGCPCEVHHAVQLKKPVLIVSPQGKHAASKWYFGYIRHRYIFGSWQELYDYLQEVDEYKHKDNHRWWYVYKMV